MTSKSTMAALVAAWLALSGHEALAANQTPTTTPVVYGDKSLPFGLKLQRVDTKGRLPTLQAFAMGQYGKYWVLLGGRTNGLHNFTNDPLKNFPPSEQNRKVWVVDPTNWRVWSRSITGSGLSADQVDQLSATNYEDYQSGNTLYVVGGYGYLRSARKFVTFPVMTAVDLPDLITWVQQPSKSPSLAKLIRQTRSETLRVTGGEMTMFGKRAVLAFGQDFAGGYGDPKAVQTYTGQLRSFDIVDDGKRLAIADIEASPAKPDLTNFRRRDYSLMSYLDGGQAKAAALAGVFTASGGVFTVPVEFGPSGVPRQQNPAAPGTFKQGMNSYDSATLGIYDRSSGATHTVLFGGISYVTYDYKTRTFVPDSNVPFTSQVTDLVRDRQGRYRQYLFYNGFPKVSGPDVARYLFGAEARTFLKPGTPTTGPGLVDMQAVQAKPGTSQVVGWVFGGIAAEQPNFGQTVASNEVFRIVLSDR
ncbi:MAG: hypothetical protein U1E45_21760 [Geminicoccaceae bacterium]